MIITSAEQLAGVAYLSRIPEVVEQFEGWTIKLGADIDLSDCYWDPIGGLNLSKGFKGNFDGQGYSITGLYINIDSPAPAGAALFGFVSRDGATFSNVYIESGKITTSRNVAAGVVGQSDNNIVFSRVGVGPRLSVSGSVFHVGGILGSLGGSTSSYGKTVTMHDCFSLATVRSTGKGESRFVGGLIGIVGSNNATSPYPSNDYAYLDIQNCYVAGNVLSSHTSGQPNYIGAIIGRSTNTDMASAKPAMTETSKNVFYAADISNDIATAVDIPIRAIGKKSFEAANNGIDEIAVRYNCVDDMKSDEFCSLLNDGGDVWTRYPDRNDGFPVPFNNATAALRQDVRTGFNVFIDGNNVYVKNLEQGSVIRLFNILGVLVHQVTANSSDVVLNAPKKGVYIIHSGYHSISCLVK